MKNIVEIRDEHYMGCDQVWCEFYVCPNCGNDVKKLDNFCSECGCEFDWEQVKND